MAATPTDYSIDESETVEMYSTPDVTTKEQCMAYLKKCNMSVKCEGTFSATVLKYKGKKRSIFSRRNIANEDIRELSFELQMILVCVSRETDT